MLGKIGRLGILVTLALILCLGAVLVVTSYSGVGIASEVGNEGLPLVAHDRSAIPLSVVEDATGLATALFGDAQEECNNFSSQLLATYSQAKDKDFIVLFNPGGWGWSLAEASPEWRSILDGIKSELDSSGYTSLLLDYRRTEKSWLGCMDEMKEIRAHYQLKAKDLASRVEFLTKHVPDLGIILAGESTGTIISDRVMKTLADNPQVYSIQTGPPFWHKNIMLDRTLVITNNGIMPDSFSHGDFLTIIWSNLKDLFGWSQPEDSFGTVLHYVGVPGHDYRWQYPRVSSEITNFLEQNFNIE